MKEEDARGKSPHKLDNIPQMLPHPPTHMCVCPHNAARVPRPRNAFILFRQHQHQIVTQEHPGKTNPEISKIIGEMWRTLPAEEKEYWVQLGDEEKKSHLERFPDYRYQPRRSSKRNGASSFSSNTPMNESGVCAVCKGLLPGSSAAAAAEKAAQQQQQQQQHQQHQQQQQQQQQHHHHHQQQHHHHQQQQNSPVSAPGTPVHKPSDGQNIGGLSAHHYQVQLPPLQPPPANYQRSQSHPGYTQYQQQPLYQYSPNGYPMHALAPPPPPPSQHHKSSAPNLSIYSPSINMHDHQRHQSAPEAYIAIGPQQQQQQQQAQHHHQHHQHQQQPHSQQQQEAHLQQQQHQHLAHPPHGTHQSLQQIPPSHPTQQQQQQFQHMGHPPHIQGSHPAPLRVMSAPGTSSANSSISSTVSGRSGSQGSTFSRTSVGSMASDYSFHSAPSSISVPKDAGAPAVTTSVTVAALNTSTSSGPPAKSSETSSGPPKSPVDQIARKQSVVSPTQAWHNESAYQSPNRPATSAPASSSPNTNGSPAVTTGNSASMPTPATTGHSHSSPFLRPHVPFASGLTVLSEEEHQYKKRRTSSYHDPLALRPQAVSRGERYQSAIALAALKGNQQPVHGGSHLTSLYSSVSSDQTGGYPEGSASPVSSIAEGLSIRDKADALAMIGEPAGKYYRSNSTDSNNSASSTNRGRFISIEGEDHEMVKKIAEMLQEKLPDPVFSSGLYHSDIDTSAPANFHNSMAVTYWKLGYLHQMVSDIELDKNKFAILAGYTVSLVDEFANNANPSGSTGDHLDEMAYRQSWMTHVSSLKGLPSPDYMVYLQPEGGLSQGELTVAELKGSQKLLLIGGTKDMADKIVEKIMKTVMEGSMP